MTFIYICMVVMVSINLGNSLESTRNQSPSEERFNFFDAELLQVFNRKGNGNVLLSPISIKLVLGMLLEGAEDKTAAEIRAALRLPEEGEARRKEFNTWLSALQMNKSQNVLKVANRMFLSNHCSVKPDYEKTVMKYYSGGVTRVRFEDARETSRVINSWVGNRTSQLIPSIVQEDQISPENKLMLASVVYFKGFWSSPFPAERSSVRCFYYDNDCKESVMMMETGYFDYGYISRLDAKAIVLPYTGGKFSMLLLLPSKRDGVELLGRDLVHISLSSVLSELNEEEVFVQIPRFEIAYNGDLAKSLENVQVSEVFTPRANLSKMFTTRLDTASVGHVYHSAKITVNEEGSEAAAATGAMFVPLMGGTTTSFVANHPFLFFVMSSAKNALLFAGKVVSPQTPEELQKRVHTLKSQDRPSKITQNYLHGNSVAPPSSRQTDTPRVNLSADLAKVNESLDKTFHEFVPDKRGQKQAGPKFRSIKPFSIPRISSKERKISSGSSPITLAVHRPYLDTVFEADTEDLIKRWKTLGEGSKNRKRKEPSTDDWRRHVLFFT